MAAAALAAAEPFKAVLRRMGRDHECTVHHDLTRLVPQARFHLAPAETPLVRPNLGSIDAISGGAITNATLYALIPIPRYERPGPGRGTEDLDLSNVNRYMLARASDCGHSKVAILGRYSTTALTIYGERARFTEVASEQFAPLAPWAIIGADDIPTRWQAQRLYPVWLGVGATSHFATVTSSHEPDQACARCLHPYNEDGPEIIPTVSFVSFWAGLLLAVRLVRYAGQCARSTDEQVIHLCPLLCDLPHARMSHVVQPHPACPIHSVNGLPGTRP